MDDPGSLKYVERLWRRERNDKVIEISQTTRDLAGEHEFKDLIGTIPFEEKDETRNFAGKNFIFHQFEPHLISACDNDIVRFAEFIGAINFL